MEEHMKYRTFVQNKLVRDKMMLLLDPIGLNLNGNV